MRKTNTEIFKRKKILKNNTTLMITCSIQRLMSDKVGETEQKDGPFLLSGVLQRYLLKRHCCDQKQLHRVEWIKFPKILHFIMVAIKKNV